LAKGFVLSSDLSNQVCQEAGVASDYLHGAYRFGQAFAY